MLRAALVMRVIPTPDHPAPIPSIGAFGILQVRWSPRRTFFVGAVMVDGRSNVPRAPQLRLGHQPEQGAARPSGASITFPGTVGAIALKGRWACPEMINFCRNRSNVIGAFPGTWPPTIFCLLEMHERRGHALGPSTSLRNSAWPRPPMKPHKALCCICGKAVRDVDQWSQEIACDYKSILAKMHFRDRGWGRDKAHPTCLKEWAMWPKPESKA
jgi:hypothetical protein